VATPCDLQEDCEFDLGGDLLPQTDEVAIGDTLCLEDDSLQSQPTYDPSQSLDDLFAGLNEEHLIDDNDASGELQALEDGPRGMAASESNGAPYEDSLISAHHQDQIIRGLEELSRLGSVLENVGIFTQPIPTISDTTIGEFFGFAEIFDTRLATTVYKYFSDCKDPPWATGVLHAFNKNNIDHSDLDVVVDCLDGGLAPSGGALQFDVEIQATRRGEVRASDPEGDVDENTTQKQSVVADLEVDCSFGVDLETSDEFFVVVRRFDAALTTESTEDYADTGSEPAPSPAEDVGENTEPNLKISVKFDDAITEDGRIDLAELEAIDTETAEDFVELETTGALLLLVASAGPEIVPPEKTKASEPDPDTSDAPDVPLPNFTTDISELKNSILDAFSGFDDAGKALAQSGEFDTPLPVIDLCINQLFSENPDSGLNSVFDLYTPALEYFTLFEVFNLDLTDELNLSKLGSLPDINAPKFSLNNPAHKDTLKNLIEGKFEVALSPDWDIGQFLPEIWSLLDENFRPDDYLPKFQLLLGLPYLPAMKEIRSDLKSLSGSLSGSNGLLEYIETTRLKPFFNGFSGQHSSEPFLLGGEYFQERNEIQIDVVADAMKNIDLTVDLEHLFPDRFAALGISLDDDLTVTATLALNFDVSFAISAEDFSFTVRNSSVAVQVNEEINGPGVSVAAFPGSNFGISEGRFDFDSRIEQVFHGLDPPSVMSSGTLSIELPIVSDNPVDPTLYISIETNTLFDPATINLSAHLSLAPEDPTQAIVIGDGSSVDLHLDQAVLNLFELFDTVTIGQNDGSHIVEIGSPEGPVYFDTAVTISNPADGGEVFINGSVVSEGNLAIFGSGHTTTIGNGSVQNDGEGALNPALAALNDNTTLIDNFTALYVEGDLTISDTLVINGDVVLVAGGNITIDNPGVIKGNNDGTPDKLTLSAGGNITIVGAIGGDGLQDLIVEDAVDVTFHNLVYLEGNISVNATGVISDQGIISNNYVSWELLSGTPDFLPQGPGTTYDSGGIVVGGGPGAVIGGDATEQGPAGETSGAGAEGMIGTPISGAVTAVAVHPINPAIVYIATVNGGIWKTENIEATKAVPLPDIVDQLRDSGPDVVDAGTSATQGANGDLPEGTYRYKITFVNTDLGTESNASLALSVTIENGKRINLTNIPIGPVGTTARKIYRADPGEDTFKQIPDNRLSATLQDNTTRAVTDNVLLANLTDPPMVTVPFPHWKPMTDTIDSLSITTLVFDPLDPIGNTLYAGIGITSSAKVGGNLIWLLKTTDGGETWSVKGGTDLDLRGLKITGIAFASPRLLPLTDLQGMAPDITGLIATAASVADSKLTAGTYQYKITFVDKETGRESLASEPITMALGQGQNQITLNRLPVDPAGGNKARYIYRTTPDGSLFFLVHVENNNNANQNWVNAGPVIDPALLVSTRGAANPAARGGVYRSEDGGGRPGRASAMVLLL